jgi:hypothetical protein
MVIPLNFDKRNIKVAMGLVKADYYGPFLSKNLPIRTTFNYKHLYYLWVVAKEVGIPCAADKLAIRGDLDTAKSYGERIAAGAAQLRG